MTRVVKGAAIIGAIALSTAVISAQEAPAGAARGQGQGQEQGCDTSHGLQPSSSLPIGITEGETGGSPVGVHPPDTPGAHTIPG